jgi:DNA-binding Lrp family transcriptional regulator
MMYKSYTEVAKILGCSARTVQRKVKEMMESGDYPSRTVLLNPKRVDLDAVIDYCGKEKQ